MLAFFWNLTIANGGFLKWGYPPNQSKSANFSTKTYDDFGIPHFKKHPNERSGMEHQDLLI
jgi:hypothetical protein